MIALLLAPTWRWVWISAAIVVVLIVRSRGRGVLGMMSLIFLVMAFGQVLVHLRGGEIYQGIVTDNIEVAVQGFVLALAGLLLADLLYRQRRPLAMFAVPGRPGHYVLVVGAAQLVLVGYAALVSSRLMALAPGASKGERIAVAGPHHYTFLTLSTVTLACWPLVRASRAGRVMFRAQLAGYVGYCVLTDERDFVFVLLGLSVLSASTQLKQWLPRAVGAAGAGVAAVELLGSGRSGGAEQSSALFQGSLLFVDTRVHQYVPSGTGLQHGATYLEGIASALTHGHRGGHLGLTDWLVEQYAPGSGSGYGFSMTAEAYLNFGQVGILPVFLVAGLAVNFVVNRIDRSPLLAHLGYFLTMFLPYMLRSDSRGLFAGLTTCLAVHLVIALVSGPADRGAGR